MRHFLIKLLNGYTEQEMTESVNAWRVRALASETTVELFKEIVKRERDRSDKIENDIRERMFPHRDKQEPPDMKPVGNSVSSWPRIRRELEKQHRVHEGPPSKEEVHAQISREETES